MILPLQVNKLGTVIGYSICTGHSIKYFPNLKRIQNVCLSFQVNHFFRECPKETTTYVHTEIKFLPWHQPVQPNFIFALSPQAFKMFSLLGIVTVSLPT